MEHGTVRTYATHQTARPSADTEAEPTIRAVAEPGKTFIQSSSHLLLLGILFLKPMVFSVFHFIVIPALYRVLFIQSITTRGYFEHFFHFFPSTA